MTTNFLPLFLILQESKILFFHYINYRILFTSLRLQLFTLVLFLNNRYLRNMYLLKIIWVQAMKYLFITPRWNSARFHRSLQFMSHMIIKLRNSCQRCATNIWCCFFILKTRGKIHIDEYNERCKAWRIKTETDR